MHHRSRPHVGYPSAAHGLRLEKRDRGLQCDGEGWGACGGGEGLAMNACAPRLGFTYGPRCILGEVGWSTWNCFQIPLWNRFCHGASFFFRLYLLYGSSAQSLFSANVPHLSSSAVGKGPRPAVLDASFMLRVRYGVVLVFYHLCICLQLVLQRASSVVHSSFHFIQRAIILSTCWIVW